MSSLNREDALEAALLEVGSLTYFDGKTTWMHVPEGWFERRNNALLLGAKEIERKCSICERPVSQCTREQICGHDSDMPQSRNYVG